MCTRETFCYLICRDWGLTSSISGESMIQGKNIRYNSDNSLHFTFIPKFAY